MASRRVDAKHENEPPVARVRLTKKEGRIYRLVQLGLTNKQIASQLSVTDNTVKFHLKNIYEKYGVGSRRRVAVSSAPERIHLVSLDRERPEEIASSSCS